jgi:predicted MFS family arabinose efflux permease
MLGRNRLRPNTLEWQILMARGGLMILIVAAFVSMMDRSVMPPLVPVIAADLGTSVEAVGHSLTVYAVAYAAFQLVWSTLATRWGRIRVLTVSTAVSGAANVGSALAADPLTYAVTRGLAGAAFAATITTVLIYFGDTQTMKQRAVATANLAAAVSIGLAAGTVGAGVIAQWWSWRWVYVAIACGCAVLTVMLARLPEPVTGTSERLLVSIRRLAGNRWALAILFFAVVEGVLLVGVFNYLPVALQAEGASVLAAGLATAAFGVTVVVVSQLMKLVLGRWPPWLLLLLAGLSIIAAYTVLTLIVSLGSVLAGTSLLGMAWAFGHTTIQTWMTDAVADSRAIGMAFFSISLFVGASIGAALGNVAASGGGFAVLFLAAAAVSVFFAAATSTARARYRVREAPQEDSEG